MKRSIKFLNGYFTEQLITVQKETHFRYNLEESLSRDFTLFATSDENDLTDFSGWAF